MKEAVRELRGRYHCSVSHRKLAQTVDSNFLGSSLGLGNGTSKVLYRFGTQTLRLIKVTAFRLGIRKKWVNNRRIREKGSDQGE